MPRRICRDTACHTYFTSVGAAGSIASILTIANAHRLATGINRDTYVEGVSRVETTHADVAANKLALTTESFVVDAECPIAIGLYTGQNVGGEVRTSA